MVDEATGVLGGQRLAFLSCTMLLTLRQIGRHAEVGDEMISRRRAQTDLGREYRLQFLDCVAWSGRNFDAARTNEIVSEFDDASRQS